MLLVTTFMFAQKKRNDEMVMTMSITDLCKEKITNPIRIMTGSK